MTILITAENLSKSYPRVNTAKQRFKSLLNLLLNKEIKDVSTVLEDISFKIKKGESLAIIGKNGAGKSTLLKIISKVIKPSSGSIEVEGKVGALLELGAGFHPDYTGRENLKMSSALSGLTNKDIENKIDSMISFADIGDYIDQPVKTYSSGMVVRLGFSVVTVTKPDLLITDEVLAVGDTDFQRKCITWIDEYLENGGTLLLVSHSLYHVQKLCKQAIWLENGKIKKQGDSFTVSQQYQSYYEVTNPSSSNATKDVTNYHIIDAKILNKENFEIKQAETYDDITVVVDVFSPDNRKPGLAFGITKGEFPIYGTISDLHKANAIKLSNNCFQFQIKLPNNQLLPADYHIKVHAMDPECLRLIDTYEIDFRIYSQTHELGVVRLKTLWH